MHYALITNTDTQETRGIAIKHSYKDAELKRILLPNEEAFLISQEDLETRYSNYFDCYHIMRIDIIQRLLDKEDVDEHDALDIIRESRIFGGLELFLNNEVKIVLTKLLEEEDEL